MNTRSEYDDLTRFYCGATVRFYFGMSKILLRNHRNFEKSSLFFQGEIMSKYLEIFGGRVKRFL